ncbi:MAG: aminotransferase class V-fold PLP-dependent enzyme [Gaiellaceae bacterium]
MTFDEARALFPVLERVTYLNAGTFGPLARETVEVMLEQLERDLERGRSGKPYIDEMIEERARVRGAIAELVRADPERISLTASTTDGCNIVLLGLGLEPDDEIVTTDTEHFGLAGPVFASGATVRVARVQQLGAEEALEAIAAEVTEKTRLLAVSHVIWTNGVVLDVHALKERTGVPIVVDGAQSVGAIDVDVRALDYYTVSGQKWLCGPESTGALYVADADALRVARPGYFAQQSFEPGGRYVPREGAERFDPGWISVAALKGLATALGLAPEWRFERIAEAAARCREALAERVRVVTPAGQAGLVTFEVAEDPEGVVASLLAENVVVRSVPGTKWLRASCGWWTSDDDIARLVRALSTES